MVGIDEGDPVELPLGVYWHSDWLIAVYAPPTESCTVDVELSESDSDTSTSPLDPEEVRA